MKAHQREKQSDTDLREKEASSHPEWTHFNSDPVCCLQDMGWRSHAFHLPHTQIFSFIVFLFLNSDRFLHTLEFGFQCDCRVIMIIYPHTKAEKQKRSQPFVTFLGRRHVCWDCTTLIHNRNFNKAEHGRRITLQVKQKSSLGLKRWLTKKKELGLQTGGLEFTMSDPI